MWGGVIFRELYYLKGMPFWLDEMLLGQSLFKTDIADLFSPLENYQKCPPLFCVITFIILKIFGYSCYSFRLLPFMSSIMSIFLFSIISLKLFKTKIPVLMGLLIFSVCPVLIYYSQEYKPYSTDVLVCLFLIFIYDYLHFKNINTKNLIIYSISAFILPIFSFSAIFIIPAVIIAKTIEEKYITKKILIVFSSYILANIYLFFLYSNIYSAEIEALEWKNGFLNLSFSSFYKIILNFFHFCIYSFNDNYFIPVILFLVFGFIILFKNNRKYAILIALIIFFLLVASFLKFYPFHERLILFTIPIFILLIVTPLDDSRFFYIKTIILSVIIFLILNLKYLPYITYPENYLNRRVNEKYRTVMTNSISTLLSQIPNNTKIITTEELRVYMEFYNKLLKYNKTFEVDLYFINSDFQKTMEDLINKTFENNQNKNLLILCKNLNNDELNILDEDSIKKIIENIINKKNYEYTTGKDKYMFWYLIKV